MCSNLLQINIRIYQALGPAKLTEPKIYYNLIVMVILNELLTNETTQNILKSFVSKGKTFMKRTEEHVNQGCNPGGIYQAI